MNKDTGIVSIHGKEYKTVAHRVNEFRNNADYAGWGIDTEIISNVDGVIIMKAIINDAHGKQIGAGTASEKEGSTNINKTSHIENCETSAIGRALASIGLAGTEYASADEVVNAISNQNAEPEKPWYKSFADHKQLMVERVAKGEQAKDILKSIAESYKVSKEVREQILAIQPPH